MAQTPLNADIQLNGWTQGDIYKALLNIHSYLAESRALNTQLRRQFLYNTMGNPGFVIDTNFDVKNGTAFFYTNNGTLKTLAANTNFDTGTAKTVTGSLYSSALLCVVAAGTGLVTWAASSYASEALAIAALPVAPNATDTVVGYFTIQAHASGFTAGTDALTTGAGGNVATATTYYNNINPNAAQIGAAASETLTLFKG